MPHPRHRLYSTIVPGLTHGIYDPASYPDPAGPRRQPRVGQAPQGQQEVELGQVLQGVLVGPLNAVEHLGAGAGAIVKSTADIVDMRYRTQE